MASIRPFEGQLVEPSWVSRVVSPAYDAMNTDQRVAYRSENPDSYLHVTRSPGDEPDGETDTATLIDRGRTALERLVEHGAFARAQAPALHVYRLGWQGHEQFGLVGEYDAETFARLARPHEETHASRTALLVEHMETVAAASSPVAVAVDDDGTFAATLRSATRSAPDLDFVTEDGLEQQVWRIDDAATAAQLEALLDERRMYIVDGHHRAAANAALSVAGRAVPLLTAVFSASELHVLGFHRLVPAGGDTGAKEAVRRIRRRFVTEEFIGSIEANQAEVVMFADQSWFMITFDERPISSDARIRLGALDPVVLEREIIQQICSPDQIEYVPATVSPYEVSLAAEANDQIAFIVAPVDLADVIVVADGGLTLPPKSTYFIPKVRSGIFLRRFD